VESRRRLAGRAGEEASLPVQYLQYRGGIGMLAWAFHRISGVAVWLFIVFHVFSMWLVTAAPDVYEQVHAIYSTTPGRIGEILLGAALLYHALNGLRIIVMDLWPATTVYQRQMWIGLWVVFVAVGGPMAAILFARMLEGG
jgi:succinate dehydrogenase / fumarate reductase cytochrome b subunit